MFFNLNSCTSRFYLLTIDLRLPDGIADTPKSGGDEEGDRTVGMWLPQQQPYLQHRVHDGAEDDDRRPSDVLHDGAEEQ